MGPRVKTLERALVQAEQAVDLRVDRADLQVEAVMDHKEHPLKAVEEKLEHPVEHLLDQAQADHLRAHLALLPAVEVTLSLAALQVDLRTGLPHHPLAALREPTPTLQFSRTNRARAARVPLPLPPAQTLSIVGYPTQLLFPTLPALLLP